MAARTARIAVLSATHEIHFSPLCSARVMHVLLQIFQRNFRFFHAFNCKIAHRLFKMEWT